MKYKVILVTNMRLSRLECMPLIYIFLREQETDYTYTLECETGEVAHKLCERLWAELGVDAIHSIDVEETQRMSSAEFAERFAGQTWPVDVEGPMVMKALCGI